MQKDLQGREVFTEFRYQGILQNTIPVCREEKAFQTLSNLYHGFKPQQALELLQHDDLITPLFE